MSKSDELYEEIKMIDERIITYKHYMQLRNTGRIVVTDRLTQIDLPILELSALETYSKLLMLHWSLEYEKERNNEQV